MNNTTEFFTTPKGTKLPLRDIRGKLYLDCIYRVQWFREQHPDWKIHTNIVNADKEGALVRAVIMNDKNEVLATAHRYQDKTFKNYIEKAESQAIGRALALCSFGTTFAAADFEESDDPSGLADSPSDAHLPPQKRSSNTQTTHVAGGSYVVQFGKYKGKAFDSIPLLEAHNYAGYLLESAGRDGKPLSKLADEFISAVNARQPLANADQEFFDAQHDVP